MDNRISPSSARITRINELEAENARLHRTAADLTAYVRALQNALSNGAAPPRRPAGLDDAGDRSRRHGA